MWSSGSSAFDYLLKMKCIHCNSTKWFTTHEHNNNNYNNSSSMSGCGPLDHQPFDYLLKMKFGGPGLVLFLLHLASVHTASK